MIFSRYLKGAAKTWREEDAISRCVIMASLLLVFFAYLPTLRYDYATQDQWRAFRYSVAGGSSLERAGACVRTIPGFYVLSGRPFVWITECVEHAAVFRISDFIYLRPFVLAIVLATVTHLGFVLSPFVGGLAIGVAAAAALVVAPGYSFMYLQGMPAAMVLISVILAAASFNQYSRRNEAGRGRFKAILSSFFLFLSACLIYPAYAFVVLPLVFIEFGFSLKEKFSKRFFNLLSALGFYFGASVFYYAMVKAAVFLVQIRKGRLPNLGGYEVTIQLTPALILERARETAAYFYAMPPLNFSAPYGLPLLILAAFSIVLGYKTSKNRHGGPASAPAFSLLFFLIGAVILLASISPWLFSKMESHSTRHVLPWYLFFCAAAAGLLSLFLKDCLKGSSRWASAVVLLGLVLPAALVQNRLSMLEVAVTNAEIETMRTRISGWIDGKGWIDKRYLLVVRPMYLRPAGMENKLNNDDNAVMAAARNPVSIPWMVNALLRERPGRPEFHLVDCAFDQSCANGFLQDTKNVVLGYTDGAEAINSAVEPYMINLSALTSRPVIPPVVHAEFPRLTVSSVFDDYGPYGLLSAAGPGWHAERHPKYPQTIAIDFREVKSFRGLSLLPQDGFLSRMPKAVRIKSSDDGISWAESAFGDICEAGGPDGWHSVKLARQLKARFLRIDILANCGDPDFLTLRGLRVE